MEKLRYLSLFSGIEAWSHAVKDLPQYMPVAFAEVEPFASAVLSAPYPHVKNLGDVTRIDGTQYHGTVEIIVGGSPCQDWSQIGKRQGLDGKRSVLALEYLRLLEEVRPRWLVFENVQGLLNCHRGADLQVLLQKMDELRYHVAWALLDSKHFGLAQRRKRVFIVGSAVGWEGPAQVLLEPASMCRNPPALHEEREANPEASRGGAGGRRWCPKIAPTLTASAACFSRPGFPNQQLDALIVEDDGVRRLTVEEAERLQGFETGYTDIVYRGKRASDGDRYRVLGNTMSVPVMRYIAERILIADQKISGRGRG